jgi:hypothetical protein
MTLLCPTHLHLSCASRLLTAYHLRTQFGTATRNKFFKCVLEAKHNYKNISVDSRLIFILCGGRVHLCIPECLINSRSARKITISHAHSTLAHLGSSHTVGYAHNHLWWKTMVANTAANIETAIPASAASPTIRSCTGCRTPWLSLPLRGKQWELTSSSP